MANEGYEPGHTGFAHGLSTSAMVALADQSGFGLWNWNVVSDELRMSEAVVRMLGYEMHELAHLGATRLLMIFDEDRPLVEQNIAACLDGKQNGYRLPFRLSRKDGSIVSVLESAYVCERDAAGKALRMAATITDLSALRHAEQKIQALEKENRALRDEDTAEGELVMQVHMLRAVNAAAAGVVGGFYRNYETSLFQALAGIGESFGASALYVYRNVVGSEVPACYLRASWKNGQTLPAPYDAKTRWAYEDFLPGRLGDLRVGKSLRFAGADIPASLHVLPDAAKARGILLVPLLLHGGFWGLLRVDDRSADRLFTESEAEIAGGGTVIVASSIARNETLDKLNEARKAAMASTKAKSEFLARMSHEIRTPMNAIIGLCNIARKSNDLQQAKDALGKMDIASKQLLGIINDVLDMSKIDSGRLEISAEPFDFDRMLQNVLNVVRVRLDEKFQQLHLEVKGRFTRQVVSDELRLSQVLINLLGNAIKFTPVRGEINLKVRCCPIGSSLDTFQLRIEVSDTGMGIDGEAQKKLFTPFEQADGGMSRRFGGTGLGLAISKRIVDLMGGGIWVKSEEGKGATFGFEVPACWGGPLDSGAADLRQMHILVVDDSALARQYFTTMLESFQQVCETAENGEKAVEMIINRCEENRPYDICFLDWNMPGMNGGKTARTIRHIAGDVTTLVMVSVSDWADIEQEARSHGITHYLPKPVLPTVLYNRLMELSRKAPPSAEVAAPRYNWHGKTILLVEDIEINREIIFGLLEDTGLTIVTAENGQEAVDKFTAQPQQFSAILMDVQMPVKDGLAATKEIRALPLPWAAGVPIIAMTANAFKEDHEASLEAGMNEHIAKPIEVDVLYKTLAEFLNTGS